MEIASESNCTFQPKINKKSERLAARSPFDMSLGDSKRQETNRRLLKLEREQAALSGSTFKPKISTLAKELGKSHLQLSSEKTNFLEKYHEQLLEREKERQLELQRREEAEREGCTFVPETRDCPAYVKRIAKSMAIVKAARGNSSVYSEEKPQWK